MLASFGKTLIVAGVLIAIIGIGLVLAEKIGWIGRLPGDFVFRKGNFTFYFPLGTSILLSVLLSILYWIFRK